MSHHTNIVRIKSVATNLGHLKDEAVFVGGSTVSLYASRKALEVRPTDDVDIVVELLSYANGVVLQEQLAKLGFYPDSESAVICRYKLQSIIVDIMSTTEVPFGFTNKWYKSGFDNAIAYTIDEHCTIKILTAPYFIATKLEAFKGRGEDDGRTSHDFEDIVFVLENREEFIKEFQQVDEQLNDYLKSEFNKLLNNPHIEEWIDCHVERGIKPATTRIIQELKQWLKLP